MADFLFLEKLNRMIYSQQRPRLMHRKGIGAKGYFRPYMSFKDYTDAEIFMRTDEDFPVKVRFSSMFGEKGTADTARNIKGFSARFYSCCGEYDLICQSLPVYFINSLHKFFSLSEALSVKGVFDGINTEKLWRFTSDNPEAVNCVIRLFSNSGTTASYTDINWYSVGTHIWENKDGIKRLIRYRWIPLKADGEKKLRKRVLLGKREAEFMAGIDPDAAVNDLIWQIEEGDFPAFELLVQMADYRFVSHPDYLKRTVCWNDKINPPVKVGILKLTKLVTEDENICFAPGNTVEGICPCDDEFSRLMDYIYRVETLGRV